MENKYNEKFIKMAIEESDANSKNNFKDGGPFGAVIVKDNEIIGKGHNTVVKGKDPTAHAEVNAIREACKKLNTHDLSDCVLYASAEPCPMCLSAIIWSNIKEVYYVNTREDSAKIGFRDDMIYEYIQNRDKRILDLKHLDNEEAIKIFEKFENDPESIIY